MAILVALMDLGFATHGVHLDQRLVFLNSTVSADKTSIQVVSPPNGGVYPPGPGYLFVIANGGLCIAQNSELVLYLNDHKVPSVGQKVMIGSGGNPPVDHGALAK